MNVILNFFFLMIFGVKNLYLYINLWLLNKIIGHYFQGLKQNYRMYAMIIISYYSLSARKPNALRKNVLCEILCKVFTVETNNSPDAVRFQ